MTIARRLRWIGLFLLLAVALSWLVVSIHGLGKSATEYHLRVHDNTRAAVPAGEDQSMRMTQQDWGKSTMFAVAAVAFVLMMLLVHGLLHDRRPRTFENGR